MENKLIELEDGMFVNVNAIKVVFRHSALIAFRTYKKHWWNKGESGYHTVELSARQRDRIIEAMGIIE